ncbi:MAG: hypothetical protein E4H13_10395 [Calditrichales bacterium]|nr:MAG: hypothetical protein E4H13_10395 [Calditrichales bacterium]
MVIRTKNVSSENFKNYGYMVTMPELKPTAEGTTYKFWSDIAHYHVDGETEIGLCTVYKEDQTVIASLERHRQTPEILIPIDAPFDVPVQNDGLPGSPVESFRVHIGQAVVINTNIWHGASIPVGKKECTYFVIFRRGTPGLDVEFKDIPSVEIIAP